MGKNKNIFIALGGGILLGLPWSYTSFFAIIFIAWIPLLHLEEKLQNHPNRYSLFNYALLTFTVWNIIGTWWISQAQLVGAILIILLNSLVQALIFWSISRARRVLKIPILLPFILIWLGFEHFHQYWELSWPWLNMGNSLATQPKIIQWYQYTGTRGGTLWIIVINVVFHKIFSLCKDKSSKGLIKYSVSLLLLFTIPIICSLELLKSTDEPRKQVDIMIIQPNLDPYTEKFVPQREDAHMERFLALADSALDPETRFLVGPETFIVQQIDEDNPYTSKYYHQLLDFKAKHPNLNCLLGIHSYKRVIGDIPPGSRFNKEKNFHYEAFNTALFLSGTQEPQFYHKTKLVPLFERMPFVDYLKFLGKYSIELGGYNGTYSRRQSTSSFISSDSTITILPVICFESIFGSYCAKRVSNKQGFISIITNDGWWKNTPGYIHHFNFSILRAIESRRDVVRVANNGISAIINAKGTIIDTTQWWKESILKGKVQLRTGQTFYCLHGDFLGRISLFFSILLLLVVEVRNRIGFHNKMRN